MITLQELKVEQPEAHAALIVSLPYRRARSEVDVLDYLAGNLDRNAGNLLVELDEADQLVRLVPIDHDLTFPPVAERVVIPGWARGLPARYTRRCLRHLEAMVEDQAGLVATLGRHLTDVEVAGVLHRLEVVLADVALKVRERGTDAFWP